MQKGGKKRKHLGALIATAILILIFIFSAIFLKSVLFGMMFAGIVYPMQKWYANKFLANRYICGIVRFLCLFKLPFIKLRFFVLSLFNNKEVIEQEIDYNLLKVKRAFWLTLFTIFVIAFTAFSAISWGSAKYVIQGVNNVKKQADEIVDKNIKKKESAFFSFISKNEEKKETSQTVDNETYFDVLFSSINKKLESFKPTLLNIPGFEYAKENLAKYLKDSENINNLLMNVLDKSGGVFKFTMGAIGNLAGFILNLLLTLFFFTFFLEKMGMSDIKTAKGQSSGDYFVDALFHTDWLPKMTEETIGETKDIINEIISKLKAWVRGYFLIIIIETTVYIVLFSIMGVPYAVALGCIAGLTILLPFIGPLISCILTMMVCFALGGDDINLIFIVLIGIVYLLMNGIIEQLILYPSIVGEALGLTTLETIIVVLLGGLFAGIPGMIFAVPVTSIAKSLIPKIYSSAK